jgi:hypothetical protein
MRIYRTAPLIVPLLLTLLLLAIAPMAVHAARSLPGNATYTQVTMAAQEEGGSNGVGAAVALAVVAIAVIAVLAVVIIAAVALGIIGLGYRSIQGDE